MVPQILSRSQRRMERQQALLLLALVLAVSLVSFALGVMVGRGNGPAPAAAPVARLPVTPPAGGGGTPGMQDLTFYESLPKGGKPPLGSGINLPASAAAPRNPVPANQPQVAISAPTPKAQEPVPSAVTQPPPKPPAPARAAVANVAPPAEAVPPQSQAKAAGGTWTVQAASFQAVEDAQRLKQRLTAKGFAASVQAAALGEKGTWYRVIVGPFESEGAASGAASRLREEEKLSVMIRKS